MLAFVPSTSFVFLKGDTFFLLFRYCDNSKRFIRRYLKSFQSCDLITTLKTKKITSNKSLAIVTVLKKKKKRFTLKKYKTGRWDENEHSLFVRAFMKYGNDWKSVESVMQRRSAEQIRSHSQKLFIKLSKDYTLKNAGKGTRFDCEFDRKFMEIFRKDKRRVFFIRKIHKDHNKSFCAKRRKTQHKVFVIEKTLKCKKMDYQSDEQETTNANLFSSKKFLETEDTEGNASNSIAIFLLSELQLLVAQNRQFLDSFRYFENEMYFNLFLCMTQNQNQQMNLNPIQDLIKFLHYIDIKSVTNSY